MKIEKFEDILAWQKAKILVTWLYRKFSDNRDFSFRDQIERAAVSIMNNIAEGFERQTDPEFRRFLFIAKGSCGEARSMLSVALELKYISEAEFHVYYELCSEISRLLSGFIKSLK